MVSFEQRYGSRFRSSLLEIIPFGIILWCILVDYSHEPRDGSGFFIYSIIAGCAVLFFTVIFCVLAPVIYSKLIITVEDKCIKIVFGGGLYKKEIPMSSILDVKVVRIKGCYEFKGFCLPSTRPLVFIDIFKCHKIYHIGGKYGVRLDIEPSGLGLITHYILGSDRPEDLAEAIKNAKYSTISN